MQNSKPNTIIQVKIIVAGDKHYDESPVIVVADLINELRTTNDVIYCKEYPKTSLAGYIAEEKMYIKNIESLINKEILKNPTREKLAQAFRSHPRISQLPTPLQDMFTSDILKYNPTVANINVLVPVLSKPNVYPCFIEDRQLQNQLNAAQASTTSAEQMLQVSKQLNKRRMEEMHKNILAEYNNYLNGRKPTNTKPLVIIVHVGWSHIESIMNRLAQSFNIPIHGCMIHTTHTNELLNASNTKIEHDFAEKLAENLQPKVVFEVKKVGTDKNYTYTSDDWKKYVDEVVLGKTMPEVLPASLTQSFAVAETPPTHLETTTALQPRNNERSSLLFISLAIIVGIAAVLAKLLLDKSNELNSMNRS